MKLKALLAVMAAIPVLAPVHGSPLPSSYVDASTGKPRVFVLTDIGNEPDDQMSLVRFLVYSNDFDVAGIVATTSTWQRTATHPETIRELIAAYGRVRPNLTLHARGWPTADDLLRVTAAGQRGYGLAAIQNVPLSDGARLLITAADRPDPRPLWISIWGGANTLAEALQYVRTTRSAEALALFVAKLRVYSISDQDDAGPWVRREFSDLFYVVEPSTATYEDYRNATWTGISGDLFYHNGAGADGATVTNDWLDRNIRQRGPLGAHYPRFQFIMEGDTPSFLWLIDNGLNAYRNPSWGGWGGRYVYRQPYGETHRIWTQGVSAASQASSLDTVTGIDGREYLSDQATIWRWRNAYQNDFAARMAWTVEPYNRANHNPQVIVNRQAGTSPVMIEARVGVPVVLDASASRDPDRNHLTYRWFHYAEAGGSAEPSLATVSIGGGDTSRATVTATATCPADQQPVASCPGVGVAHIILAVTDDGAPALTSYRRIILRVRGS